MTTKKIFWYLVIGILLVYVCNLFIGIMEIDAAQYASISMEMFQNKKFLQVYERGHDYLDKPPLLFWLVCLSYKLFGIATWTYKLPSVIIILLGFYATYRFTLLYYSKRIALLATLIAACSQALFLITNDVRMDGVFMGFMMLCFWQTATYLNNRKWYNLILSALFIACALMVKGPLALIIFMAGFGFHFICSKQWKNIFNISWLWFVILIMFFLLPMCYGLYTQFDLHPEKYVYGLEGPSGLKFFFWTQSFGRITGDIYWNNGLPFHFFLGSMLWDLQPWIFFFYPALFFKIKNLFSKKNNIKEYITLGGFVFPFIALSLSHYKLPHYVFPLFPFASIIVAEFLEERFIQLSWKKIIIILQFAFIGVLILAPLVGFLLFFPTANIIDWTIWIFMLAVILFLSCKKNELTQKVITISFVASIFFNLIMAIYFYPNLLYYQSETQAVKYANAYKQKNLPLYTYKIYSSAFDFYGKQVHAVLEDTISVKNIKKSIWIYTNKEGKIELEKIPNLHMHIVQKFQDYHITQLRIQFLLASTRNQNCDTTYLIQLYPH